MESATAPLLSDDGWCCAGVLWADPATAPLGWPICPPQVSGKVRAQPSLPPFILLVLVKCHIILCWGLVLQRVVLGIHGRLSSGPCSLATLPNASLHQCLARGLQPTASPGAVLRYDRVWLKRVLGARS